jgi:hypothetical protein
MRRRLLIPMLVVAFAAACSDGTQDSITSPQLSAQSAAAAAALGGPPQEVGRALAAQKSHGKALIAIQGVVGHGVALGDDDKGQITVYAARPGVRGVPATLDGVKTKVVVTGQVVALGTTDPTDPTPNGYSIGHPAITAGTLGVIVRDAGSTPSTCYILSNNHVMANSNAATAGDPILHPGPADGGTLPNDVIATLSAFEPINFSGGSLPPFGSASRNSAARPTSRTVGCARSTWRSTSATTGQAAPRSAFSPAKLRRTT